MVVITDENNFDFTDIFPTCIQYYRRVESSINDYSLIDPYNNSCVLIKSQLGIDVQIFSWICKVLSHYLENIKNESDEEYKKRNCKYFNFILKSEHKRINPSCNAEEDCYDKMIEVYQTQRKSELGVCKYYIKNLSEDTFSKFKNLNWLYYYKENLIEDIDKCPSDSTYIEEYTKVSNLCPNGNDSSFCKEVRKFKDEYMKGAKSENDCSVVLKILHQADKRDIRMVILIVSILTFTILIIIFVLYKYTPYGSYVKPCLKKLKNMRNGKNNELPILMDLFDETYKNLTDENYLISYKSLDY
ncbi:variable surface protein [Plasmodium gonderi]|uniref:Variable surface protein n=1 Tax=Plasmodium gonderi TaxID=77519 RepID=A0A1Y1JTN8_PLAGO|nr:variable surface protein [Plasmodium gonderi]GAW84122.1 variable surface protein [Plasmodium gonderi]